MRGLIWNPGHMRIGLKSSYSDFFSVSSVFSVPSVFSAFDLPAPSPLHQLNVLSGSHILAVSNPIFRHGH